MQESHEELKADFQYHDLLSALCEYGITSPTRQGPAAITLPYPYTMNFDLTKGFPVISERDISSFWHKPIDELMAFINGARTEATLKAYGVNWWGEWATAQKCLKRGLAVGDLGPGSYGSAFHDYPSPDGIPFDQFAEVVRQIKLYPNDRRHMITNWLPPFVFRTRDDSSKVTIAPCHGSLIYIRILEGGLYLRMVQRSGDVPVGVPSNMVQYAALTLALSHVLGYQARMFSHIILDAHFYEDQRDAVETMIARNPRPLASVTINEKGQAKKALSYFRGSDFELSGYDPHPAITSIPVAS